MVFELLIKLDRIDKGLYSINTKTYLDAIIKLYPEYKDEAIKNYLKILKKNRN